MKSSLKGPMKAQIHPNWYPEAKVICGNCGTTFAVGSTLPEIHVEVCSSCHPFYTGQMKYIDTKGRVERFQAKREAAQAKSTMSKKEKRALTRARKLEEELNRPESLQQIRVSKKS